MAPKTQSKQARESLAPGSSSQTESCELRGTLAGLMKRDGYQAETSGGLLLLSLSVFVV